MTCPNRAWKQWLWQTKLVESKHNAGIIQVEGKRTAMTCPRKEEEEEAIPPGA